MSEVLVETFGTGIPVEVLGELSAETMENVKFK